MNDAPRLLWLAIDSPLPPNSGGRLRSLSLIEAVSRRYETTVAILTGAVVPDQSRPPEVVEWVGIHYPGKLQQAAALPRFLAHGDPPFLRVYATASQRQAARNVIDRTAPDVMVADTAYAVAAVPESSAPLIVNTHNVEAEVWHAEVPGEHEGYVRRWLDRRLVAGWERRCLRRAQGVAFTSERDAALLGEILDPGVATAVVPNAVDTDAIGRLQRPESCETALFIGRGDYGPNLEAVRFISGQLGPMLAPEGLSVSVVGSDGEAGPGYAFAGRVDDLLAHYRSAFAAVVPLFSGSGTRLKVLEAMAYGRPVVATAKAVEGLGLTPGKHYLAAETCEEFVSQLILLRDPGVWDRIAVSARLLVEGSYSRQVAGDAFLGLLERIG